MQSETDDLDRRLQTVSRNLTAEFRGIFSPETVARCVQDSVARLGTVRVTQYVPVFAHSLARQRLTAVAAVEGKAMTRNPTVLFVCVRNAGRSQMAAGFARQLGEGRIEVYSAGSAPGEQINPVVVAAMDEVGVSVSDEFPKPLLDEMVRAANVVVTMGCGDACRLYSATRYEDWDLEDPEGKPIERVREIRDQIRSRVERLLEEL